MNSSPRVLVVGAGTTGLAMATELLRHGVACRLIDGSPSPAEASRAIGVHARTLEILENLGIAHEAIARGHKLHGINVWSEGRRVTHVGTDELESRHAYMLTIPQSETESILAACLERHGGAVDRPVALTGLTQDATGVEAILTGRDAKEERARVEWLVGCDGASSGVRAAVALPFEGVANEEGFVLADVRMELPHPDDEMHLFLSSRGLLLILPLPKGLFRIVADLPRAEAETGRTLEAFADLVRTRAGFEPKIAEVPWTTDFRIHRRIVPSFRKGRVFLAGDAAHVHSPLGDQGMNAGIQDACNLAWKLALVVRGEARPSLLDSFDAERRPIAVSTLMGTDLATNVVTLRNPVARELRDALARFLLNLEVVQERMTRAAEGLSTHYRASPIVAEDRTSIFGTRLVKDESIETASLRDWRDFGAAPAAGDRAPDVDVHDPRPHGPKRLYEVLRGTKHVLLLFDGAAPTLAGYRNLVAIRARVHERHRARVAVHFVVPAGAEPPTLHGAGETVLDATGALHRRYGAGAECAYLFRPDGYVGYRCQPADGDKIAAYLDRLFG